MITPRDLITPREYISNNLSLLECPRSIKESELLNDSLSNDSVENDQEMAINEELFQYIHWIQEEQITLGKRIGQGG